MVGRRGLAAGAAVLLTPVALVAAWRWITSPVRPERSEPPGQPPPRSVPAPTASEGPALAPEGPLVLGDTGRLAARAIDDTAGAPLDRSLLALAIRFLGTPQPAVATAPPAQERLRLDLTSFSDLEFVEQLLALVNSRPVRSQKEGVERFGEHVRQLRYGGGTVQRCRRHRHRGLWARAAERQGYLVDLSPFLPGARRRRISAPAAAAAVGGSPCPAPAAETAAYVPLGSLPAALPSLRSGDLFLLVGDAAPTEGGPIGVVERRDDRVGSIQVLPGQGVSRLGDLASFARGSAGTVGVTFLRPVPNGDGRPDR